jgi:hypothetical protein
MNHLGRRIRPLTASVDSAARANRADDGVGGRPNAFSVLDDMFEGIAHVQTASLHQSGDVGMAIDAAIVAEIVFIGDVCGIAPVQDVIVNFRAIGMVADEAFALVARVIGVCDRNRNSRLNPHHRLRPASERRAGPDSLTRCCA